MHMIKNCRLTLIFVGFLKKSSSIAYSIKKDSLYTINPIDGVEKVDPQLFYNPIIQFLLLGFLQAKK